MVTIKNKRAKRGKQTMRRDKTKEAVSAYAGDAYDLARRTMRGLNEIRKYINIEEKFLDTSVALTPDQSGSLQCITQLAQGTTMNTRVGNSLKVQRLEIKGRAAVASAVISYSLVRIIVFRDMEGQGTAPAVSDLLETVGSTSAPRQPYDWLNRKRFAILYDMLVPLTALSGGQSVHVFTYSVDLGKHVLYRGTTAAAASDGEGSIYIACVSDEATNTPSVNASCRITFTDD